MILRFTKSGKGKRQPPIGRRQQPQESQVCEQTNKIQQIISFSYRPPQFPLGKDMSEQQARCKKPRKILGNGHNTDFSNTSSQLLNQNLTTNPQLINSNCNNGNNLIVTDTNCGISPLNLQQQLQYMERIRLANIMNQEMHALWPYGTATFLSPMLPAHNMHLPYALAGTLPYAAVPIYQNLPSANPPACSVTPISSSSSASSSGITTNANNHQQQQNQLLQQHLLRSNLASNSTATSSGTNNLGSSSNQNGLNDSNKINIQIGLQCVSQNTPLNINAMNDNFAKVNLLNFCNSTSMPMGEKECKESNSSLRNSPILLSSDDSSTVIVNGAGGDATNSLSPGSNSGTVTLSQAKFNELTRLALRGSEIAEKLAYTHRNRPCFKKIDSLCARMKQDLIRPDGVLPNINSQGIAWAVKDFIFVFTRVINAWIIIKGYVYNTPEGLNKVKSALSPDFAASFAAWQDTTMDFIENLIKSFVNLDNLVQSQKNVYQKSDNTATANRNSSNSATTTPIKILQPGNPLLEESFDFLNTSSEKCAQNSLNKNYIYTMVEDSEGSQRQATVNGTYFKTGTYNPIKKDTLITEETTTALAAANLFTSTTAAENAALEQYIDEHLNEFWAPAVDLDLTATTSDSSVTNSADFLKLKENIAPNWLNYELRVFEQHLSEFSNDYDPNGPPRPLGKDLIEKLNNMIERLNSMKTVDFFFKMQFTKNYFPDFVAKHKNDFVDIRSIIFKCQVGGYQHIYEVVHDIRKIIYTAKEYLKVSRCKSKCFQFTKRKQNFVTFKE